MGKKIGVYAGTFDPITVGHVWMVERGVELFDELVVAIGENPDKHCLFSLGERRAMLRESLEHLPTVRFDHYINQYLMDYAASIGADFILRGIRSSADYEYESTMRQLNSRRNSEITTVFLDPPLELKAVSSSMVKGLVGPVDWETMVCNYVPEPVFERLKEKDRARRSQG